MLLLYVILGIVALVILVAYFKLDTFISFVLVSIGLGLACGMKVEDISKSLEKGIGSTLGSLDLGQCSGDSWPTAARHSALPPRS
jgi:H+/gluconate symporter-like permease